MGWLLPLGTTSESSYVAVRVDQVSFQTFNPCLKVSEVVVQGIHDSLK
jgi:hypothetical protein